MHLAKPTVGKWRSRFVARRLDGLLDEPRPGAPREISDAAVERVLTWTLETRPRDATHWSTRSMARRCGLSQSAVSRIWRAFALQPHRAETFQLSKDPLFIEKVRDIVGLYLHPPDKALVLCVDEEDPDSSAGPFSAAAADASRAGRGAHARLCAARQHLAVRGAGGEKRTRGKRFPRPAPLGGVPQVPRPH